MYQTILIATDGSELASKAVEHGIALARAVGSKVIVMTASEVGPAMELAQQSAALGYAPDAQFEAAIRAAAQRILDAAAHKAAQANVPCSTVYVPDSYPADAIVETAREQGADLIVMASHGRRGIGRLLLGSQTSEVLAHSQTPVLVVR